LTGPDKVRELETRCGHAMAPLLGSLVALEFERLERRRTVYLIGSLRDPQVPTVAKALRDIGLDVFDDWYAAGPEADDYWQKYEKQRGHRLDEALEGYPAWHVFDYDHRHLLRADAGVLLMPAGKSCHLELGYLMGTGKPGYVLFDKEPERFDVMYRFCRKVFFDLPSLINEFSHWREK